MSCRIAPIMALLPGLALAQPVLPDGKLTSGAVSETDVRAVCQPGYARAHRHVSEKMRISAFVRYGIDPASGHYQLDHRVPLSLGGSNDETNIWPESYDTQPWNAHAKDRLEDRVHALVCSGAMTLREGQAVFLGDWIEGYRRMLGEPR